MNGNTRQAFQDFISSVETLAHSVSSVAGTDAVTEVFRECDNLRTQLDKDETILP